MTPTPSATPVPSITPSATPTPTVSGDALLNISTRARAETGEKVEIGGFILSGGSSLKTVVVRALGPSLGTRGVLSPLLDPSLQLYNSSGQLIASNGDWMTNSNSQEIIDSGLAPTDSRESALLIDLLPGAYTAVVTGVDGSANNIALVEVYDLDSLNLPQLLNISTRGQIDTDEGVMIAGLIVGGTTEQTVVIRGLGPSLALGSPSVANPLPDPQVLLYDGLGQLIATNNNWQDTQAADIAATGLAPPDTLEAAILAPLLPGNYTAVLSDVNGASGIGLVEIYNISSQ